MQRPDSITALAAAGAFVVAVGWPFVALNELRSRAEGVDADGEG